MQTQRDMRPVQMNDFKSVWQDVESQVLKTISRFGASGHYILGPEVAGFEHRLAGLWGMNYSIGCANGLDAIELSLRALKLRPGDKVLTTPLSAFATTLAILRAGGQPVFVDVDDWGQIDLSLAEKALAADDSIRYFVPVHLYGFCLDLDRLASLKERFDLRLVEDCAQSILAQFRRRMSGSVGDLAATSFYPTKNLGAFGDGGAVLTNDKLLNEHVRMLRDYGQNEKYSHAEMGLNSRLDEIHAAVLSEIFLPKLKESTHSRTQVAERYLAEIRNPSLQLLSPVPDVTPAWHLFPLLVKGSRSSFQDHLRSHGIMSAIHYPKLIPDQPALRDVNVHRASDLAIARRFADFQVSLPVHPNLSVLEIDRVIAACNSWNA